MTGFTNAGGSPEAAVRTCRWIRALPRHETCSVSSTASWAPTRRSNNNATCGWPGRLRSPAAPSPYFDAWNSTCRDSPALPIADQEAVFGRHRANGVPLSGGTIASDPDLGAKTPDGRYLVPAHAHARRANANVVGVGLMLRRSYSTDAPGLLFMSFQNDIRTFTNTLTHMDDSDALLQFTTTTASATFLILPGFNRQHPLGAPLFH